MAKYWKMIYPYGHTAPNTLLVAAKKFYSIVPRCTRPPRSRGRSGQRGRGPPSITQPEWRKMNSRGSRSHSTNQLSIVSSSAYKTLTSFSSNQSPMLRDAYLAASSMCATLALLQALCPMYSHLTKENQTTPPPALQREQQNFNSDTSGNQGPTL